MANGLVTNYTSGKSAVVVKAIATFADVGAGNVAIMYGTSISVHRQSEIRLRLLEVLKVIIEDGFKKPVVGGNYMSASVDIDSPKSAAVITESLPVVTPLEANVAIVYSDTFDNSPASTLNLSISIRALINKLKDDVLSAA